MYSVPMALVDFIPVIIFLQAMIILQYQLYYQFTKWQFALVAGGGIMVFTAGFYKAIYKLLYAIGACNFERLNQIFFPLQATGFVLLGFAMVTFLFVKNEEKVVLRSVAVTPVLFSGTMIFVVGMVLGVLGLCVSLAVIAKRLKRYGAMITFMLAFICMLCMGYLSSHDFSVASMNWIAQGVNIVGQAALLWGLMILRKAGLRNMSAKTEKTEKLVA